MSYVSGPLTQHIQSLSTQNSTVTATKLTHVYTETNEQNVMVLYMIEQNRGTVLGALPDVPFWFVGGRWKRV